MLKFRGHSLSLFSGNVVLSKNKSFEYQIDFGERAKNIHVPFEFSLRSRQKTDHAGIDFVFSIHKLFWWNINIHDHRHWDYDNDCWQSYS